MAIAEQVTTLPDGQINERAVHLRVQPRSQKYSAFRTTQISGYLGASRSDKRGGSRVVTNAERDAVDARASGARDDRRARQLVSGYSAQDERRYLRTAKPCGPDTRCWCQAVGGDVDPTGSISLGTDNDGDKTNSLTGESTA
jgi:hypothetical protein